MTSIIPALREWIAATATLTALAGDRVHVSHVPQGEDYPQITISRAGRDRNPSLGGTSDDLITETVILRVWARTAAEATTIADALVDPAGENLADLTGVIGAGGNVRDVKAVVVTEETTEFAADEGGGDSGYHTSRVDLTIFHGPAA